MDYPKPPNTGIFGLIDDSCSTNTTDEGLLKSISKVHNGKTKAFSLPKMSRTDFTIHHTAKDVTYFIEGFRFKNRDELNMMIEECIASSTFEEVK